MNKYLRFELLFFLVIILFVSCFDFEKEDEEKPIVTLLGDAEIYIEPGALYREPGFFALDNIDGDITSRIVIVGNEFSTNKEGIYDINYMVYDRFGNPSDIKTRRVIVRKLFSNITLFGDNPLYLTVGDLFLEPGFSAVDVKGEDVAALVKWDSLNVVDSSRPGVYNCSYLLKDDYGYISTSERKVVVTLPDEPVIILSGLGVRAESPLVVELNATTLAVQSNEPGYYALDKVQGDITSKVIIDYSSIETTSDWMGTNQLLSYTLENGSGEELCKVERYIRVVFDATPPVVTFVGDYLKTLELGIDTYSEEGASAIDQGEPQSVEILINRLVGDKIVETGIDQATMNSNPGLYHVVYQSTDAAGNIGFATRIVNVQDTIAPILVLKGGELSGYKTEIQDLLYGGDPLSLMADATFIDYDSQCEIEIIGDSFNDIEMRVSGRYETQFVAVDRSGNRSYIGVRVVNILPPPLPPLVNGSFEDMIPNVGEINEVEDSYEGWYWDMNGLKHYSTISISADVLSVILMVLGGSQKWEDAWTGVGALDGKPHNSSQSGYSIPYCGIGSDDDIFSTKVADGIGAAYMTGRFLATAEVRMPRINLKEIGYFLDITVYDVLVEGAKYYKTTQGSLKQDGLHVFKDVTYRLNLKTRYNLAGGEHNMMKFQINSATEGLLLNGSADNLFVEFKTSEHEQDTYYPLSMTFTPNKDGEIDLDFYKSSTGTWGSHIWIDAVNFTVVEYDQR